MGKNNLYPGAWQGISGGRGASSSPARATNTVSAATPKRTVSPKGKKTSALKRNIRDEMFQRTGLGNSDRARATSGLAKTSKKRPESEYVSRERKMDSNNRKNIKSDAQELIKEQGKKKTAKFLKSARDENFTPRTQSREDARKPSGQEGDPTW